MRITHLGSKISYYLNLWRTSPDYEATSKVESRTTAELTLKYASLDKRKLSQKWIMTWGVTKIVLFLLHGLTIVAEEKTALANSSAEEELTTTNLPTPQDNQETAQSKEQDQAEKPSLGHPEQLRKNLIKADKCPAPQFGKVLR